MEVFETGQKIMEINEKLQDVAAKLKLVKNRMAMEGRANKTLLDTEKNLLRTKQTLQELKSRIRDDGDSDELLTRLRAKKQLMIARLLQTPSRELESIDVALKEQELTKLKRDADDTVQYMLAHDMSPRSALMEMQEIQNQLDEVKAELRSRGH